MKGPFPLEFTNPVVVANTVGAYILSRDGKTAHYVGRSDFNLQQRINQSSQEGYGYKYFWFETTSSPTAAYRIECEWYHTYNPPDNTIHPAVPKGMNWRCHIVPCAWN